MVIISENRFASNTSSHFVKGAIISGFINGMINGIINWIQVMGKKDLFLTVDSLSAVAHTVMGGVVIMASTLAIILTTIGYFTFKLPKKPSYFPFVFLLTLKNTFFTFTILLLLSISLERLKGSISVSPLASAFMVAIIAGMVAGLIDFMTKKELLKKSTRSIKT